MHQQTRLSLCRMGFVLLCIGPTLALCGWSSHRSGDSYRETIAAELTGAIGLQTKIEQASHPLPGVTRLENVALSDWESGQVVARFESITIYDQADRVAVVATGSTVELKQSAMIWAALEQQLKRRAADSFRPVSFQAAELSLRSAKGEYPIRSFECAIQGTEQCQEAAISYLPAEGAKRVVGRIVRTRQADGAYNGFELDTNSAAIPCALFNTAQIDLGILGDRATFTGTIAANHPAVGWQAAIAGKLSQVDLQSAISENFSHRWIGMAESTLQSAEIRNGRLEKAQGVLTAGPGSISESLLHSACSALRLQRQTLAMPQGGDVQYDRLACRFAIDASGLQLRGDEQNGVIMQAKGQPILMEPSGSSGPVVQLLRALVPDEQVLVPASPQTEMLMRFLPLAPAMPR
ncbi:MAG: hypothetical protein SGJ20_22495 [Planctomycetota bacterium]|nr:hypothetical protein [Planctomycetota bacterium]